MSIKAKFTEKKFIVTIIFVTSLFMLWGIAITMGDVLNRHFQNVLGVTKAQSGLVQFRVDLGFALITTELGVASTLIIFVAESTRTMDALRSSSRDFTLDVEGDVPVMFSISALRKSCSAAPLLGSVIHSARNVTAAPNHETTAPKRQWRLTRSSPRQRP